MIIRYARVSTDERNQKLEPQTDALTGALQQHLDGCEPVRRIHPWLSAASTMKKECSRMSKTTLGTLYAVGNVGMDKQGKPIIGAIIEISPQHLPELVNFIGFSMAITHPTESEQHLG